MTLLVAWAGADNHGTSSVYIAADSRISDAQANSYDFGRKVFAFSSSPDILAYCGDVLFPSIALSQITALSDAGQLFSPGSSAKMKCQAIVRKLNDFMKEYPKAYLQPGPVAVQILHVTRDDPSNTNFVCNQILLSSTGQCKVVNKPLPTGSDLLCALGSGATEFQENYKRYQAGNNKETSRAVFHCFCDLLTNTTDVTLGGAPQLVGIYRKPRTAAFTMGVIFKRNRYFLGAKIDNHRSYASIEWRNTNFERCDGRTKKIITTAQRQPDPHRRKI